MNVLRLAFQIVPMGNEVQTFVESQGALVSHQDIVELANHLPVLRERFVHFGVLEYPDLHEQYEFLALLVEDYRERIDCKVSQTCERETAFALLYFEKRGELPSECLHEYGPANDEAVVATVLYKHRDALRGSPRGYLFRWEANAVDFDHEIHAGLHDRLAFCPP